MATTNARTARSLKSLVIAARNAEGSGNYDAACAILRELIILMRCFEQDDGHARFSASLSLLEAAGLPYKTAARYLDGTNEREATNIDVRFSAEIRHCLLVLIDGAMLLSEQGQHKPSYLILDDLDFLFDSISLGDVARFESHLLGSGNKYRDIADRAVTAYMSGKAPRD